MVNTSQIAYHRCYTCGRWHPVAGVYAEKYCSRECARVYGQCPVCGEYFQRSDTTKDGFCSAECRGIDDQDRPKEIVKILGNAEHLR